jgi:hypothetical protein
VDITSAVEPPSAGGGICIYANFRASRPSEASPKGVGSNALDRRSASGASRALRAVGSTADDRTDARRASERQGQIGLRYH